MAHQFSALHRDGFVRVSHQTRERLREVNMLALGLITEMSAHVDGFPVTLDAIIKRAQKPGAAALREAYQDLIDERLVVYVQYTLQLPGRRPYPSGTTVIAHEAITDTEFTEHIVCKFTPGQWVLDHQADGEVRKVKVLHATVRFWGGKKKITDAGELAEAAPTKKPGPKKGTKKAQPGTTQSDSRQDLVELDRPSSTFTSENEVSSQRNVELGDVDSTSPSSFTRRENKTTNQTTGASSSSAASQTGRSGDDGWLAGSPEKDPNSTAGTALLRSLGITGRALNDWSTTVDAALVQLGEQQTRHTLENGLAGVANPSGAIITTRLPQLHGRLTTRETPSVHSAAPAWCGECGDPRDPNRERKCRANVRMRVWPDGTPCSCRTATAEVA